LKDKFIMSTLPKGAEALLIAIQTPAPKGYMGIPVLIWGKPGEGKSSFLEGLARPTFPVFTLIASIHDPTDFSGLPVFRDGALHYAVPEWVRHFDDSGGQGILFLDELTTAPPAVQSALLRVVLERTVGFHPLDKGVRIVAAANPPDLMTGGWDLSPPLRNRFVHLEWELGAEVYLSALEQGFESVSLPQIPPALHEERQKEWKILVVAFLKQSPYLLTTPPDQSAQGFASPRSWDFAIALMASCDCLELSPLSQNKQKSDVFYTLLKGCIGEGTALAFMEFVQNMRLPNADDLLDGKIEIEVAQLNDGELYVLFGALQRALERRHESPTLTAAVLRFQDLIQAVFDDQRRDVIYVSLRKAAKTGIFAKVLAIAQQQSTEEKQRILNALNQLFNDEGLKEFIDVFER
jgi:AAA domain (dynein-related subfamily)